MLLAFIYNCVVVVDIGYDTKLCNRFLDTDRIAHMLYKLPTEISLAMRLVRRLSSS